MVSEQELTARLFLERLNFIRELFEAEMSHSYRAIYAGMFGNAAGLTLLLPLMRDFGSRTSEAAIKSNAFIPFAIGIGVAAVGILLATISSYQMRRRIAMAVLLVNDSSDLPLEVEYQRASRFPFGFAFVSGMAFFAGLIFLYGLFK